MPMTSSVVDFDQKAGQIQGHAQSNSLLTGRTRMRLLSHLETGIDEVAYAEKFIAELGANTWS